MMINTNQAHDLKMEILGGGVAGLGCALALTQQAGLKNIRIYEQASLDDMPYRKGHGLMLMQNGVRALHTLKMSHLLAQCTPLKQAVFQDGTGYIFQTERLEDVYCMSRATLVDGLLAALPEGTVQFDQPCIKVELTAPTTSTATGQQVQSIQLESTVLRRESVDLFIDATGHRSPLCYALNPGLERPISRVREIVTSTHLPRLAAQLGNKFVKTVLPERGLAFGLLAPTPERVIGFLQFDSMRFSPPTRDAASSEIRYFLQTLLRSAPHPVPTYLRQADFSTAHVWHPINADIPDVLHCDNAIAIGDAAHPVLPFTSQGVSAALEDAILLGTAMQALPGDRSILPQTLARFSTTRRCDLNTYIEGGRRILADFLHPAQQRVVPYIETVSSQFRSNKSALQPMPAVKANRSVNRSRRRTAILRTPHQPSRTAHQLSVS